jgi:predicted nucleotidyltransferase
MDFEKVIQQVIGAMEAAKVRYALIGGFAMALRGVQRATVDLDFILMLDDLEKADAILKTFGYERAFRSENVSHYQSEAMDWGRIDILHAFRGPSLSMLRRADLLAVTPELTLRVVQIEDIIGLKIQALQNDPRRLENDWHDIRLLVHSAAEQKLALDWELIEDYLSLFQMQDRIEELRKCFRETD